MRFSAEQVRAMQAVAEAVRALARTQGRLFDGWPSGRVYQPEYDAARVQRLRASAGLGADVPDEIIFDACCETAARRRHVRYGRYADRVARAMSQG